MLSNNSLCLCAAVQYVLLFLVWINNSNRFQIYVVTRSYSSCPFLCTLSNSMALVSLKKPSARLEVYEKYWMITFCEPGLVELSCWLWCPWYFVPLESALLHYWGYYITSRNLAVWGLLCIIQRLCSQRFGSKVSVVQLMDDDFVQFCSLGILLYKPEATLPSGQNPMNATCKNCEVNTT